MHFPYIVGRCAKNVFSSFCNRSSVTKMFFCSSAIGLLQYPHLIGSMDNSQGTEWVRLLYIQKYFEQRGEVSPYLKITKECL